MSRPIDADALLRALARKEPFNDCARVVIAECMEEVRHAPTINPERKTGKWLKTGQSFVFPDKFRNYFCSECGFEIEKIAYNYCPNCGEKKEEGGQE